MEVQIVWCEDTNNWGVTNDTGNSTWERFPNNSVGIMDAVASVHKDKNDAIFLLGGGMTRTFNIRSN